ncbi:MAG: glycosyltransferase family 2 protein [Lachnospiraceae bacterium]|nr:glycosyltransferase family 2 protein [Lachnospiraceae bacterium]
MITISVCMIVKNEAPVLARCLDSLVSVWDELIIVDTGSEDETMEIARRYTDKVYEFKWTGDFSEARNFALAHATCDYIYTADADEILEGDNVSAFLALKSCLDESVDVVQMYYGNQLDQGTVYNFDKELRPKLFRRMRPIRFTDPIHETLDLDPVVIDSDIVITHKPTSQHSGRDLEAFGRIVGAGGRLSSRLQRFLCRELYMHGDPADFERFAEYLYGVTCDTDRTVDEVLEACTLLARYHRLRGEIPQMFDNVVKVIAQETNSEVCDELGAYYLGLGDHDNAAIWYYNAWHEVTPVLSVHAGSDIPLHGLSEVYRALGNDEMAEEYARMAEGEDHVLGE